MPGGDKTPVWAHDERPSTEAKDASSWQLHVLVFLPVLLGGFIIVLVELSVIPPAVKDFALALGGALMGVISLVFDEILRARPERRRSKEQRAKEREEERRQHREELDEAHQKFLALESELSASMRRAADLQAQLELVGSHERSRIYAALMMGYFYDRRDENLGQGPPVFVCRAKELELPADELLREEDLVEFLVQITNALTVKYGPVVRGAFNLGCLLRDLDKGGFSAMCDPKALEDLQSSLKLLKIDPAIIAATSRFWQACDDVARIPDEASSFFHDMFLLVSGRFLEIARSPDVDNNIRRFIENPIRIPKAVRVENTQPPEEDKSIRVTVCGRPVLLQNSGGSLVAIDLEDIPTEEDRRWGPAVRPVRTYGVRLEPNAIVLERTWGYANERPPRVGLSVAPPSDPRERVPKVVRVKRTAAPPRGEEITTVAGDRRVVVFNSDDGLFGVDEDDIPKSGVAAILHVWDVQVEDADLLLSRCWRYSDEPGASGASV